MKLFIRIMAIYLTLLVSLHACNLNFTNGHALAVKQDSLITIYKENGKIENTESVVKKMRKNFYINSTWKQNPTNLHIRQYLLICVFDKNITDFSEDALQMINDLSVWNGERTWLEGYSYWLYTKVAIELYIEKYPMGKYTLIFSEIIKEINTFFRKTAFYNAQEQLWYPAPFGDLRKRPLEKQELMGVDTADTVKLSNVMKITPVAGMTRYIIDATPIGLNTHTQKSESDVYIFNGVVSDLVGTGFSYYTGYSNKYKDKKAEIFDYLSPKRIKYFFTK